MVEINESVLLTFAGMVFIPVFVFAIKMIMEVGNVKTRIDNIEQYIKEAKEMYQRTINLETELRVLKQDIGYRFTRQDESNVRIQRDIDRLNQFSYGSDSKSIPAYLSGEDETQKHRDKADVGIFKDPDSTRRTTTQEKEKRGENKKENE